MKPNIDSKSKTLKTIFKPKNPQKYKGDCTKIISRSSYELKCMLMFDSNPNVIWWQSEERSIAYRSPVDNSLHRYFPDFIICIKGKDGKQKIKMIEVKPKSQTKVPVKTPKKKKYLTEVVRYSINIAKWKAAKTYCERKGWEFEILTEDEIFGKRTC